MAVKRETESTFQSAGAGVGGRNYQLFTSWQNIKLRNFLLSPSILANLLLNFGFLPCFNELNSFKLRRLRCSNQICTVNTSTLFRITPGRRDQSAPSLTAWAPITHLARLFSLISINFYLYHSNLSELEINLNNSPFE